MEGGGPAARPSKPTGQQASRDEGGLGGWPHLAPPARHDGHVVGAGAREGARHHAPRQLPHVAQQLVCGGRAYRWATSRRSSAGSRGSQLQRAVGDGAAQRTPNAMRQQAPAALPPTHLAATRPAWRRPRRWGSGLPPRAAAGCRRAARRRPAPLARQPGRPAAQPAAPRRRAPGAAAPRSPTRPLPRPRPRPRRRCCCRRCCPSRRRHLASGRRRHRAVPHPAGAALAARAASARAGPARCAPRSAACPALGRQQPGTPRGRFGAGRGCRPGRGRLRTQAGPDRGTLLSGRQAAPRQPSRRCTASRCAVRRAGRAASLLPGASPSADPDACASSA